MLLTEEIEGIRSGLKNLQTAKCEISLEVPTIAIGTVPEELFRRCID